MMYKDTPYDPVKFKRLPVSKPVWALYVILILLFFSPAYAGKRWPSDPQKNSTLSTYPNQVWADKPNNFCMVTQHAGHGADYLEQTIQNQQHYALRHGYTHEAFLDRVSGGAFVDSSQGDLYSIFGGGLYWQKVAAVQNMLAATVQTEMGIYPRCRWVLWLDSDAVITNETILLEDIVKRYAPDVANPDLLHMQVDIILSTEEYHPVNAGAFMVRNTAIGRGYMDALAALYPLYKDTLLPEQSAMTTLSYLVKPWPCTNTGQNLGNYLHPSIAIVPQRTFNSFPDFGRNLSQEARWSPCDFVAHFAGIAHSQRARGIHDILATTTSCDED